jgi:dTDP-glucose 4,6-dehydratase
MRRVVVTGGAGFIGSQVVRTLLDGGWDVVVLDRFTYAGRKEFVVGLPARVLQGDVADADAVAEAIDGAQAVVHLAAESHVPRSLADPALFLRTNVEGTRVLLEAATARRVPRFLHVSTDEVFGSAAPGVAFHEDDALRPGNPYAASKAAAEALVHAWRHSFGYPAAIVRCTNNYGPRQHPEKAVPTWILAALAGSPLTMHGDGGAVRDWLHVEDFARGLSKALVRWRPAATWHFAGRQPRSNRDMAARIGAACGGGGLVHVGERQGQDRRYAIDDEATRRELRWEPVVPLERGLDETVLWYREHGALWEGAARAAG